MININDYQNLIGQVIPARIIETNHGKTFEVDLETLYDIENAIHPFKCRVIQPNHMYSADIRNDRLTIFLKIVGDHVVISEICIG